MAAADVAGWFEVDVFCITNIYILSMSLSMCVEKKACDCPTVNSKLCDK